MLKDVEWPEDGTYTPQGKHKPIEFFNNALSNSVLFDIQLGYFNSAAIHVLAGSFATFIKNGGYMRMAINQIVSRKDKIAITEGENGGIDAPFDLTDWNSIKNSLDEYGELFFRCLAYLIQEKRIEIQIIKPKETSGIAHTKRGQFIDANDMVVGFSGSANFTLGGLFNNLENIDIFLSTSLDNSIRKKLENNKILFSNIMSKQEPDIEYLSTSDLEEALKSTYGDQDIDELIDIEKKLKRIKYKINSSLTSITGEGFMDYNIPHFPYPQGPHDYQIQAFDEWKKTQKGLFAMATGTGKTITSLNCLYEIYKRCGYYKAIILVPTITLVEQWESECRKFNFNNIIKVSSKNGDWKSRIERLLFTEKYSSPKDKPLNYIIISTYASFSKDNTYAILNSFERTKTLLIADEAHNMGSPSMLKKLKTVNYLRRIGLSATPERQYDDETNNKLYKFFGSEEKFTFEYTMEQAIQKGVLCRYYYYPHVVQLTEEEMEVYVDLSLKIAKYYNCNNCAFEQKDKILTALLLARKRVIHKAQNKLDLFTQIINDRYKEKGDLKYTLVYVPEGNKPDYVEDSDIFETKDQIEDDIESDHLIDVYTKAIMDVDKYITVRKFVSGQKNREEILKDFASGKMQVLTSMKCLDEGVDVPRSEMAIFCASTGNPRQFIQRRGRVLRTHKDKHMAILHDLVVIPKVSSTCDSFKMEQSLLKGELLRVKNFSLLSENPSYSQMELRDVMQHYGLNLYNNNHIV